MKGVSVLMTVQLSLSGHIYIYLYWQHVHSVKRLYGRRHCQLSIARVPHCLCLYCL